MHRPILALAALLAACGGASPPGDASDEAEGAAQAAETPWSEAARRGVEFRALGQEPGWVLELGGGRLRFAGDYGATETVLPFVQAAPTAEGPSPIDYAVGELVVRIHATPCQDTMSGERFTHAVTVTQGGRVLEGCGRILTPA